MKRLPILLCLAALALCELRSAASAEERAILMASTIGPIDAGIVAALEDEFEKQTGIRVRHVGAGTGEALKIGEQGNVDLLLVHAKKLEEKFVAAGFGTERIPFMYNDFVIVGPAGDPAGIRGTSTAPEALRKIARSQAKFVSRGDRSGTHVAEMALWEKAGVKPAAPWYTVYEKGSDGNAPTLSFTDREKAYTVIDRATLLTMKGAIQLQVLVENDEALLNRISLIPINPGKFPRADFATASRFIQWLTAPDQGQKLVRDFGRKRYGSPLFFPDSREWHALPLK